MVAQCVDGRLDSNYAIRLGEISDCKPGGKLISKARAEYGLMFGIPKSGSAHFAMLVAVKENKARIGPMIVGVDRTASVQLVHQWRRNLALFNQVGSGNRPVGILSHRVDCREFLEGFLLGMRGLLPTLRKRKRCPARCKRQKLIGQGSAGRRKITLARWITRSIAPPPPIPALLSNHRLPVTTML